MTEEKNEMDLFDLIDQIIKRVKTILLYGVEACSSFIKFNIRCFFVILIPILLGIAAGFYVRKPSNSFLKADFLMPINGTTSLYVAEIVKVLGQSIDKEENQLLANKLKLEPEVAKHIKGIQPYFAIDLNNNKTLDYIDYSGSFREDSMNSRMNGYLDIQIKTRGVTDFGQIQKGIVEYLRNDPYLKKEEVRRIQDLKEKIVSVNREIKALADMREKEDGANLVLIEKGLVKSTTYYDDMINLEQRRTWLTDELALQPNVVSTISGVKISGQYSDKQIFTFFVVGAYFLGLFVSLIIAYRKQILSFIKSNNN